MMTPVFATTFPIETAIWIVLVVIGVISSIVSNARKAVRVAQSQAARPRRAPAPPATILAQSMPAPAPAVAEVPPVINVPPPVVTRRQVAAPAAPPPAAHGTRPFRGMFERENLVRAMIASEVLGPPKALQEQSIWSPRHSEPSI